MVTKAQCKILKEKRNEKDYTYVLMSMLWTREVLLRHTISGKKSNAFKDREVKPQLDPDCVKSICGESYKLIDQQLLLLLAFSCISIL